MRMNRMGFPLTSTRGLGMDSVRGLRRSPFPPHNMSTVALLFIGFILGLPIDVRHVTLSSGALASAVVSLGLSSLSTWEFWLDEVAGCATAAEVMIPPDSIMPTKIGVKCLIFIAWNVITKNLYLILPFYLQYSRFSKNHRKLAVFG